MEGQLKDNLSVTESTDLAPLNLLPRSATAVVLRLIACNVEQKDATGMLLNVDSSPAS